MLAALGRACARHHWVVLGVWASVVAVLLALAVSFGGAADNVFTLPGSQSQDALDLLQEDFPAAAGATATVVYHTTDASTPVTDASVESAIESAGQTIAGQPDVERVVDPSEDPSAVSSNGRTALQTVLYTESIDLLPERGAKAFDALEDAVEPARSAGLDVHLGGPLSGAQPSPLDDEVVVIGLIAALIVLLIALGTWWTFLWPVAGALVGVLVGRTLIELLERVVDVPTISGVAATMIGLGVGIDYGLFVVGRYKQAVVDGRSPEDAGAEAIATSGRAVLTAGSTVLVALLALLVFDIPAVTAIAYAVVLVVASVMAVAVTLQPAVLGLIGQRAAAGKLPWERRKPSNPLGARWATLVTAHAHLALGAGLALLLVLAIPVFAGDLRLGPVSGSLYATDSTQYKASQLQSDAFGPGSTDPFLVVVEVPAGDTDAQDQVSALRTAIGDTAGVASVSPAEFNSAGSLAVFELTPTAGAQAAATADLVSTIRDDTIPPAVAGTGLTALVSGANAVFVDLDDRIGERLVWFILIVLVIAFVILATVFRSLLIPAKAAIFNVVTILATYGVFVAVFTLGWGRSLLGVPMDVPMLSLLAPVVFAVLFGLSNDYEVYLVSRMREEHERDGDAVRAARVGHAAGSRVVIAAALVMIFVFGSYVFQPGTVVKEFGFALAVAILLDALVTRMVMLPAAMTIGGRAMWWWPGRRRADVGAPTT